jgi:hypothetical protein
MADTEAPDTTAKLTEETFLADRMSFWSWFTGLTTKTTVAIIVFCAWLWWCGVSGFSLFHVLTLPVALAAVFYFL